MEKETTFYILFSMKTIGGFESYSRFFIGNNRELALRLFQKLEGRKEVDEKTVLTCELMETIKGLPVNLKIKSCSLAQLTENCKIITNETFKILNLYEL